MTSLQPRAATTGSEVMLTLQPKLLAPLGNGNSILIEMMKMNLFNGNIVFLL